MKVTFINPTFKREHGRFSREQRSPAITKGGTFYYPMWLAYSAGVLDSEGAEVDLIDAPARGLTDEDCLSRIESFHPDVVVIDTSTPSIASDAAFAEQIKERLSATTVMVGPHPSAQPEETLKLSKAIDAICRGEYDWTILDIVRAKSDGGSLAGIAGLTYANNGAAIRNPDRPMIEDLDQLPFVSGVYRKHLRVEDYFYTIARHPVISLVTGRGCPNQCFFCVYPQTMFGRHYRMRSVANILDEIEYIQSEIPQVKDIFLEDDTFTTDSRRVAEFAAQVKTRKLNFSYLTNSRANLDYPTLKNLKDSGCRLVCVGFESGDQTILNNISKNLRLSQAADFAREARRAGILVHGCFMAGLPGETKDTLKKTIDFARSLPLDSAQFFPLMVYPGTEAYNWAERNHYLLHHDYSKWVTPEGLHNFTVSLPEMGPEEMLYYCDLARKRFYLRFSYILYRLIRLIRFPREDFGRIFKSLRIFARHLVKYIFK
ncbi:B12-binding domain-containing radical SAM protein [candidate division KSB1 bacterium]